MIYGIEKTTSHEYPESVIRRFTSPQKALRWQQAQAESVAWPGAANVSLPVAQQNWHRRVRYVYTMPPCWRPNRRELRQLTSHPMRYSHTEALVLLIRRDGALFESHDRHR